EAGALLFEADDAQIVGALDRTRVGGHDAREHVQERRLAAAVRADQPDASARRDDEIEIADEPAAAERLRQAARDQEPARAALRRDEVDAGRGGQPARASVLELLDQASGLLDAPPGLRRARLGALTQPFDLAPHRIGERFLIGRLPAQELV